MQKNRILGHHPMARPLEFSPSAPKRPPSSPEAGELSLDCPPSVQMDHPTPNTARRRRLLRFSSARFKRVAGGGSPLHDRSTAPSGTPGRGAFATRRPPATSCPLDVGPGHEYLVQPSTASSAPPPAHRARPSASQQSLGAGIFGGDGFLLQKKSAARGHLPWPRTLRRNSSSKTSPPANSSAFTPATSAPSQSPVSFPDPGRRPGKLIKNMIFRRRRQSFLAARSPALAASGCKRSPSPASPTRFRKYLPKERGRGKPQEAGVGRRYRRASILKGM